MATKQQLKAENDKLRQQVAFNEDVAMMKQALEVAGLNKSIVQAAVVALLYPACERKGEKGLYMAGKPFSKAIEGWLEKDGAPFLACCGQTEVPVMDVESMVTPQSMHYMDPTLSLPPVPKRGHSQQSVCTPGALQQYSDMDMVRDIIA